MTYNWIVFDMQTMNMVGAVTTNHSISLADAFDLIGAERLKVSNYDDPDLVINGKVYWSGDLSMLLEEDYEEVRDA